MSWLTLTILTILFWGVGQVLIKRGLSHVSPWQTYALDTAVTLFVWIPYGIIAGLNLNKIDLFSLAVVVFLGISFSAYYYLINKAPISIVTPIFSSAPVGTLLISRAFFGEFLNPIQIISVILTILGVILLTLPAGLPTDTRSSQTDLSGRAVKSKSAIQGWVVGAIFLTAIFSFEPLLFKLIISRVGNGTFMVLLSIGQVAAVLLWYILRPVKSIIPKIPKKYFSFTILGVILFNIGTITDALALERGLASLVAPLANLNVAVIVILSLIFLKEKITPVKVLAVILILTSVIIISSSEKDATTQNPAENDQIDRVAPSGALPTSIIPTKSVQIYSDSNSLDFESSGVKYVLDGDTVELNDGRRVRLIGIDSPEVRHENQDNQCFSQEARKTLETLISGQDITLEKDTSQKDKYNRLLRYIYSDGIFINDFMVRQGYAKALSIPPDLKFSRELESAQLEAKENLRGLWKECQS